MGGEKHGLFPQVARNFLRFVLGEDFQGVLKKSVDRWFASGHGFSRADKLFYFSPEPALAGGI